MPDNDDDRVEELEYLVLKEWKEKDCTRGVHIGEDGTKYCLACGIEVDCNIPVSVKDGKPKYRPDLNDVMN